MKVAVFNLEGFSLGKEDVDDERLDPLREIFNSKKITPVQIEFVAIENIKDAEVLLSLECQKTDLILSDLDYVQDRLTKEIPAEEKTLFSKAKEILEKEEFLSQRLTKEELKVLKGFPLLTMLPVYVIKNTEDLEDPEIFKKIYYSSDRICFFTAGEKEARAWSIHKGETAYEAAGCIHSDIKQGFIRAEVTTLDELFKAGHYNQLRNEGKIRLEGKEYIVKDGDLILFRSGK
jgi:ribosome-binding ATPase YchF (GTP1/OBG family)